MHTYIHIMYIFINECFGTSLCADAYCVGSGVPHQTVRLIWYSPCILVHIE